VDAADQMLDVSRKRFEESSRQFSYITGDYRTTFPASPFDLIISSLSIHHLIDEEKKKLFKDIYRKLKPGGSVEMVTGSRF